MTTKTTEIREALFKAVHGLPMPSVRSPEAGELMSAAKAVASTSTSRELSALGTFALKLLVDRLMADFSAERDEAMLVDRLRGM